MATTTKTTAGRKAPRVGKPQANKTALRSAIAAMNDGSAEKYLELFRPDARLHGFPEGIDDVQSLSHFHTATAEPVPRRLGDPRRRGGRARSRGHPLHLARESGPGITLVAQGGAIVRFADGQIAECWNLPSELEAVAPEHIDRLSTPIGAGRGGPKPPRPRRAAQSSIADITCLTRVYSSNE